MSIDVLSISAKNFELTEAIYNTAVESMNKVLTHDKDITALDVTLEEKTAQKIPSFEARANLSLHGKHYHVEDKSENLYASIHGLADKLLRDVRREHRKFQHDRKHS